MIFATNTDTDTDTYIDTDTDTYIDTDTDRHRHTATATQPHTDNHLYKDLALIIFIHILSSFRLTEICAWYCNTPPPPPSPLGVPGRFLGFLGFLNPLRCKIFQFFDSACKFVQAPLDWEIMPLAGSYHHGFRPKSIRRSGEGLECCSKAWSRIL